MWRSRWRCVIKPAYTFSFLLSINICMAKRSLLSRCPSYMGCCIMPTYRRYRILPPCFQAPSYQGGMMSCSVVGLSDIAVNNLRGMRWTVHVTRLGIVKMRINCRSRGDHHLSLGWHMSVYGDNKVFLNKLAVGMCYWFIWLWTVFSAHNLNVVTDVQETCWLGFSTLHWIGAVASCVRPAVLSVAVAKTELLRSAF